MIIAVDTGNKQIKTEHFVFHSGLQESEHRPQAAEPALFYSGKYYVPSSRRIRYMRDKTADNRFYILTLIAVAKEVEQAVKNGYNRFSPDAVIPIDLLVDLPPAHFPVLYEKFEQYFLRDQNPIPLQYGSMECRILIRSATAYPQAYAAFLHVNQSQRLMGLSKVLVVDIGGFTSDYLMVREGMPDLSWCDSLERGVILLFNRIIARVRQKHDILLEESDIEGILQGRDVMCPDGVKEEVKKEAEIYVEEFLGEFRELGIDFALTYTVFTGGGAVLLEDIIEKVYARFGGRHYLEPDIHANAKGCRLQYLADIA